MKVSLNEITENGQMHFVVSVHLDPAAEGSETCLTNRKLATSLQSKLMKFAHANTGPTPE